MSSHRGHLAVVILAAIGLFCGSCVPDPEDPIDFGTVCFPATDDCGPSVELTRNVSGRNQVDYVVTNTGSTLASVEVVALVPSAPLAEDGSIAEIDPDDLITRREHTPIEPGVGVENRFTAQDLGVRDSLRLGVRCTGCEVELEWVFASVPRECFENADCPAGWQCDDNLGRCVECLSNADCADDQRCNLSTGRCDPPETTAGCSTTAGSDLFGLLVFVGVLLVGRRRRRLAALTVAVGLFLIPLTAAASPPRASIAIGAGGRVLLGALGPVTKRGVGLSLGQELRWRYVGAGLSIGTSYFLTNQEPPPFSRSLQTYGATLGPRFYLPLGFMELAAGADYRRLGTANNSLIRLTGPRTSFDAAGGFGGVRFRWSGLEIRLESSTHYVFQVDSTMVSADLFVGFTNVR